MHELDLDSEERISPTYAGRFFRWQPDAQQLLPRPHC
jgi:hypothetical protein